MPWTMKLTREMLERLPEHPRDLSGSRQWRPLSEDALLKRFAGEEFSEVRSIGDTLDLYKGDDWEWSVARQGFTCYLRRVGLVMERDLEWATMPGAGRAGVAVYVGLRWQRAIARLRERRRRRRSGSS